MRGRNIATAYLLASVPCRQPFIEISYHVHSERDMFSQFGGGSALHMPSMMCRGIAQWTEQRQRWIGRTSSAKEASCQLPTYNHIFRHWKKRIQAIVVAVACDRQCHKTSKMSSFKQLTTV